MRGSLAALAYLWRHGPLGWLVLVSLTALLLSASSGAHASLAALCGSPSIGSASAFLVHQLQFQSPFWLMAGWLLMVAAMMPPLLSLQVAHVRHSSFAHDRPAAFGCFALGYLALWGTAGLPLVGAALIWKMTAPGLSGTILLIGLGLVWSASPIAQAARNRCHRLLPIDPNGSTFIRDSLGQGLVTAMWCASSCWPWMMLPLASSGHHGWAMAGVTIWLFLERLEPPSALRWRCPPAVIAVARFG